MEVGGNVILGRDVLDGAAFSSLLVQVAKEVRPIGDPNVLQLTEAPQAVGPFQKVKGEHSSAESHRMLHATLHVTLLAPSFELQGLLAKPLEQAPLGLRQMNLFSVEVGVMGIDWMLQVQR